MIRLKNALSFAFFLCVTSCTQVAQVPQVSAPAPAPASTAEGPAVNAVEDEGQQVARHLNERYADTRSDCGKPSQPAFLCSGVMIRATVDQSLTHVWDNSADAIKRGGVSFSYLRADSKYSKFAYGRTNGYVMKSYFYATGKLRPEVLCFFPIDANTNNRDNRGCGAYPGYFGSNLCYLSGVNTAAQWWARYNSSNNNRRSRQCGFDVSDGRDTLAAPAFMAGIGGMKLAGSESFATQNELVLATWANGLGAQLPLEAFFYLSGSATGLASAQQNQRDLIITDNVFIPVIKITLPRSPAASVKFEYAAGDQS